MRKSRFSEERIVEILKVQQAGLSVAEVCRRHGISDATFCTWRSKRGRELAAERRRFGTGGCSSCRDRTVCWPTTNACSGSAPRSG